MKSFYKTAVALVLFSPNIFAQSIQARIDSAIHEELTRSGTPSLQVAIARDGVMVYSGASGLADVENQVRAHSQSRYRSASVSKWFTAIAALKLVEEGKMTLDTQVQEKCDAFPDKSAPVTVEQILAHRSGIRHYLDYQTMMDKAETQEEKSTLLLRSQTESLSSYRPSESIRASLHTFADDPLLFTPGSDWQYSSHAYRVLGCALEGASRMNYNDVIAKLVFAPANMTQTLPDDARALIPHRVRGYRVKQGKLAHNAELRDVSDNLPGGGHLTNAEDLVKLAQAFSSGALVSRASRDKMVATRAESEQRAPHWRDAIPAGERYGLGIMSFPTNWGTWYGHTGRQAGGSAIVMHHPDYNVSIAVLTNAKGWSGYMRFTEALAAIVLAEEKAA